MIPNIQYATLLYDYYAGIVLAGFTGYCSQIMQYAPGMDEAYKNWQTPVSVRALIGWLQV